MKNDNRHSGQRPGQRSRPSHGKGRGAGPGGRAQLPGGHGKSSHDRGPRARQGPGGHARPDDFSAKPGRWVIGIHSCEEVVKVRPRAVAEAYFRPNWQDSEPHCEIADVIGALEVPIRERSMDQLDRLAPGHQGVALRVTEAPKLDWNWLAQPGQKLVLMLDGIEDPQNLGAMLRTAWLAGVSGIFIPQDRAVNLTPAVCKVASGGAEHVAVEAHSQFTAAAERLKELGFWFYGLSEKGKARPWDLQLPGKVVWVVGNENSGMRLTTERLCDELVRLPQVASGSSFNASVAVAMALSETCRQFGKPE